MKLFLFWLFTLSLAYSETHVFEGVAKHEGQIVYYERHTVVYDDETIIKSLTEYFDPKGKVIGSLKSDYTHNVGAPEYIFVDRRHHILQGINWDHGTLEAFARDRDDKQMQKKSLPTPHENSLISGPGLIYFISQNLNKIISSEGLDVKFVVPGRLDAYDFFIKPVEQSKDKVGFEVKIKAWWLRVFTPRLKLVYDRQTRRLLSFEGLSSVRDQEGEMMSVDIQYLYEK